MLSTWLNLSSSHGWAFLLAGSLVAFLVTTGLVVVTIRVCQRHGWVANPRSDRWHHGAPCLFGGVPVWVGFLLLSVLFVAFDNVTIWRVVLIACMMFALGFADDVWRLQPRIKLLVQFAAAILLVSVAVVYPLRDSFVLNFVFSVLWIVGITNAFNLLDNMDGLAAGVGLIATAYLAAYYFFAGHLAAATMLAILAGTLAAFLRFNFKPARIFLGDTGSLCIGFTLAGSSLLHISHVSRMSAVIFVPMLVLAIPIFDTFFVSVTRRLRGQPISQGGTDHSSHRLVRLGLDERQAVVLLYALSAGSGALALVLGKVAYPMALGLVGFWCLFLLTFGIHLFHVAAGASEHVEHTGWRARLLTCDVLALLLDPAILSLSFYLAYVARFPGGSSRALPAAYLSAWPLALTTKFIVLALTGVYRRSWWRGALGDKFRIVQAAIGGELAVVLLLTGLYHFEGYSRVFFALDALFSCVLLIVLRSSFSWFRVALHAMRSPEPVAERKVFLIGTSEITDVALRFLRENGIRCVGLIDANGGSDLGRRVWGTEVVGRLDDLSRLAAHHKAFEVVLPENEPLPMSQGSLENYCRQSSLRLTKLGLYSTAAAGSDADLPSPLSQPMPPAPSAQ